MIGDIVALAHLKPQTFTVSSDL